jgi:aminotransferase in exopolysaccharide biosynthesis
MPDHIALHQPSISGNEWRYVKDCLDTGWVSSAGKYVEKFEEAISIYTGSPFAVSCINGSAALQLSLKLAGVTQGDEVLVPTITFIASVNAIHHNGASPVFIDADNFHNLDVRKSIEFIRTETTFDGSYSINRKSGRRVVAVVPVHVFGNAVWLDELVPLCQERNIAVVEDAAESLGTRYSLGNYAGQHTGTVGDIGCLSFNGNKIITSGGGGMILTSSRDIAERARYLTTQAKDNSKEFRHDEAGFNLRLTNIQAALGLGQLEIMPCFLEEKKTNFQKYTQLLKGVQSVEIGKVPDYSINNHWITWVSLQSCYPKTLASLIETFSRQSIEVRPVWKPNHLQKPYLHSQRFKLDRAEDLVRSTLCLPSSAGLTDFELQRVVDCFDE